MADLTESLDRIATDGLALAAELEQDNVKDSIANLFEVVKQAGLAHSGSWLGYHARVYYDGLERPPADARFDIQWGLSDRHFSETTGAWGEFPADRVLDVLKEAAEYPDFDELVALGDSLGERAIRVKEELVSCLTALNETHAADSYLAGLLEKAKGLRLLSVQDFVRMATPKSKIFTNDRRVMSEGLQVPPHVQLAAAVQAVEYRGDYARQLAEIARHAAGHVERRRAAKRGSRHQGTKVFIGHGRSKVWKDLKDFLQDRLGLAWDEFNRVPVAGVTNIARLSEMLDEAAIALLVMTAEDEQKDGKLQARMNVIHEAGLFQGRLGFQRAIVLLEEGCEEFSNIAGLGQIRFPAGNIAAKFEDIRQVLEREEIVAEG